MKRFFAVVSLFVCSLFVFVGCGVEGSNNVSGIKFVREVFYVDKGVKTFLDYKIYPSTAQSYSVTYNVGDSMDDTETYVFKDGYFTIRGDISDQLYSPVKITINLNDLSDTCEVRMKEYPTAVCVYGEDGEEKTSDIVYGGLTYAIKLKGEFAGEQRDLGNNEYNYKIETSDSSIIRVKDEGALLVQSTGRRGYADLSISVCNSIGDEQENLKCTLRLNVVDAVDEVFATIGNNIVKDGTKLSLTLAGNEEFKVGARYFSAEKILIDTTYDVYLSNNTFFTLREDEGAIVLAAKAKDTSNADGGEVTVTIQTKDVGADGKPVKIKITLEVQFLE